MITLDHNVLGLTMNGHIMPTIIITQYILLPYNMFIQAYNDQPCSISLCPPLIQLGRLMVTNFYESTNQICSG